MGSKKLSSLLKLGFGGFVGFAGYNVYVGDDKTYGAYVMPAIRSLFCAEKSHILAVKAAYWGVVPKIRDDPKIHPFLKTNVWNIDFENPIGLAAGFDKDGEAIVGISKLGFGFVEIGSVTPEPQPGNRYPRVFRLMEDRAIINRYGFNSFGHERMEENLAAQRDQIREKSIVVGVNLGKNKWTKDAAEDYCLGLQRFYDLDCVGYFVINISSPNTPNLRQNQNRAELTQLLARVLREKFLLEKRQNLGIPHKPLLLKLAPDLDDNQLCDIAEVVMSYSKPGPERSQLDGLVVSNTTVKRPKTLRSDPMLIAEQGGLSGAPLKHISTDVIRKLYRLTNGTVPIIGVGGVESGMDAYEKIRAGASLVQLYTSMAIFGPQIVREVKSELAQILSYYGYENVKQAVGADHRSEKPIQKNQQQPEVSNQKSLSPKQQMVKPTTASAKVKG